MPEFGVITALLSLRHEGRKSELLVSKFTAFVNAALRANDEILKYSPEEIGPRLAAMGLFTSRTKRGNFIKLTRQISRVTHDLSRRYRWRPHRHPAPVAPTVSLPGARQETADVGGCM